MCQSELLKAENVTLTFTDGAVREIARVAAEVTLLFILYYLFAITLFYFLNVG